MFTTDYVLNETITRIFKREYFIKGKKFIENLLKMVETGYLELVRIDEVKFRKAWALRLRYQDKPVISFTDLTSFVVMQELKIRNVLTNDEDFEKVNLGFRKVIQ